MGDSYYPAAYGGGQLDFSGIQQAARGIAGGLSDMWGNQKDQAVMAAYAASGGDFNKMLEEVQKAGGTLEDVYKVAKVAELNNRGNGLDLARFEETVRHNKAMETRPSNERGPYVTSAPDEYGVNQSVIFDPATKSVKPVNENKRFRPLTEGQVGKLTEEGSKLSGLRDFTKSFQDSYAGMAVGPIDYGNTMKTVGQLGIGTENADQASQWWQGYDRYKNTVRKDLYGATLTPSEERSFETADIRPGMDPARVKQNLELQRTILERAMKRKTDAFTASGFNPDVIGKAYGLDVSTLRDEPIPTPGAAQPEVTQPAMRERADLPPVTAGERNYPEVGPVPSQNDMAQLRQFSNNPQFRAEFESLYGAGSVDRWLNNSGWNSR
jgi:hypothetical protein